MNMSKKFSRRDFLAFLGVTGVVAGCFSIVNYTVKGEQVELIRPPGAITEEDFLATCLRCRKCVEVCPQGIIKTVPLEYGIKLFDTPYIESGICIADFACIDACPSGALQKITLEEYKIGTVEINPKTCIFCMLCVSTCPYNALDTPRDNEGKLIPRTPPVVNVEKCTGCGTCVPKCPTKPSSLKVTAKNARRVKVEGVIV
ncbi:MAG: 4Fe-4S dicluster domain-containing protein [Fervidobacterium sp.]